MLRSNTRTVVLIYYEYYANYPGCPVPVKKKRLITETKKQNPREEQKRSTVSSTRLHTHSRGQTTQTNTGLSVGWCLKNYTQLSLALELYNQYSRSFNLPVELAAGRKRDNSPKQKYAQNIANPICQLSIRTRPHHIATHWSIVICSTQHGSLIDTRTKKRVKNKATFVVV